jgi:hypothetical protein
VELTAAERVLVHLHGFWNAAEPGREVTQAGIADGARLLRSHVPRALRILQEDGLAEPREARLRGQRRKVRVYALTEAGVRRARQILAEVDRNPVDVDGRTTTLGEARKVLGLTPLAALAATDPGGHLRAVVAGLERPTLLKRDQDLAFLRRWLVGGAPVAVLYGSRGMGKTAVGWAFAETVPKSLWIELPEHSTLQGFAVSIAMATGAKPPAEADPESVSDEITLPYARGSKLVVIDGYGDVEEAIVDVMRAFLRKSKAVGGKLLVLAQESTPAYCRFYSKREIELGAVVERHLHGLDIEGCRALIGKPEIEEEALRRIYLLTKGCPRYLQAIREGDEATLRTHSRFTTAEIRLLLYSGGSAS